MIFELVADETAEYGEGFCHISADLNKSDFDKLVNWIEQEQGIGVVSQF